MEVVSAAKEVITSYLNTQNPDSQLVRFPFGYIFITLEVLPMMRW